MSNDVHVAIECPVPQLTTNERPLSDCCTSSTIASVITQPSKHPSSSGIDIGLHVGSLYYSDDLKMELLDSAWAPSADFVMPHSTRTLNGKKEKRYLRHEHLKRYPISLLLTLYARSVLSSLCFVWTSKW